MTAWPLSLPQKPLARDFQETEPTLTLRSSMDQGPAKTRRRTTAGVTILQCAFRLTTTERATLLTFWQITIQGGALSFTWQHPVTDAAITCRIVDPPIFIPLDRGSFWDASLKIEVLP